MKSEVFLLDTMEKPVEEQFKTLFLYMMIVYAKHWKEKGH